jgi:hypothetical protein
MNIPPNAHPVRLKRWLGGVAETVSTLEERQNSMKDMGLLVARIALTIRQ